MDIPTKALCALLALLFTSTSFFTGKQCFSQGLIESNNILEQSDTSAGDPVNSSMQAILQATFLSASLKDADISLMMADNHKELLSYQETLPLIPASNLKLFVSAAALLCKESNDLFPPLQTFARGPVEQGTLYGDLIIDSCGSLIFSARFPVDRDLETKNKLLSKQVKDYAEQLALAGIKTIRGTLRLSAERWNASPDNPYYTASSAFSFNENTLDAQVVDGILQTAPSSALVFGFKKTQKVSAQDMVGDNQIRYNPTVDSEDYWRISNTSATHYALSMLKQELRKQGIHIQEEPLELPAGKRLLFETQPVMSLSEFIRPLNKHSDNFRAELLALQLNRIQHRKAEYNDLNAAIHTLFDSNHLQLKSLQVNDGSGLSRKNRVSTSDISKLLKFMERSAAFESFRDSLSIAGETGTLKNRFKGTVWEHTFYGKTGSLNGVVALSGYWFRNGKPTITFSFIGNGADNEAFWEALERFAQSLQSLT